MSTNENNNDSVNEPVKEPVNEHINEPVKEPVNEPIKESINDPVKEPINEHVKEPINEPVKEFVKEHVKETPKDSYTLAEIDAIIDERVVKQQKQYLIRWKDFPDEDNQWIPASQLNCEYLIQMYKKNQGHTKRNMKKVERFISGNIHDGKLFYSVQYFSGEIEEISANYAHSFLTQPLLAFLEGNVKFPPQNSNETEDDKASQPTT